MICCSTSASAMSSDEQGDELRHGFRRPFEQCRQAFLSEQVVIERRQTLVGDATSASHSQVPTCRRPPELWRTVASWSRFVPRASPDQGKLPCRLELAPRTYDWRMKRRQLSAENFRRAPRQVRWACCVLGLAVVVAACGIVAGSGPAAQAKLSENSHQVAYSAGLGPHALSTIPVSQRTGPRRPGAARRRRPLGRLGSPTQRSSPKPR